MIDITAAEQNAGVPGQSMQPIATDSALDNNAESRNALPYVLVTLAVFIVSSIPYLYGYMAQTSAYRFSGVVFDVVDTVQYFAWMRSFSDSILIANPLTPEPGSARFFNLQWWLLGQLAYETPLGAVLTYQVLRVVALALFAMTVIWFCRLVVPRQALLAFVLVMTASGFGWIWVLEKQVSGELRHPLDVQIAEANSYFSAMAFPHLLIAAAMMIAVFCLCLTGTRSESPRPAILAAVLTLALGFSHGYDLIPTMAIPCATAALLYVRQRRIPRLGWHAAVVVVAAAPGAFYALGLTRLDATWQGVLSQYGNAGVFTPLPHHLTVLLGLPLLLALPQMRPSAWAGADERQLFLRVWFVVGFVLLYIPTDYQVKMLTAYQVPVCLLAAQTLSSLARSSHRVPALTPRVASFVLVGVVLFAMSTNLYLTAWRIVDLRRLDYPYYLTSGDVAALQALDDVVQPGDVVLSSPDFGMFIPMHSEARPFVAHWAQTLHYFERRDASRLYYQLPDGHQMRDLIVSANDIAFVASGAAERGFAGLAPTESPQFGMDVVIEGDTVVYRTRATGTGANQ